MCLGIPGRIIRVVEGYDLADVEVAGVVREINLALLDGPWTPGEYVLIHSGFALERMSPEQAQDALQVFQDGDSTSWSSETDRSSELPA
jgi:hydrogenase expression/formation protein HypC